ncbi:MAG: DNA polymerase I [Deltaproteobacteria bacterium]|nr:DNA polymerase I [Deltaproteobacteria bacterium]
MTETLYLIDASGYIFRAYYAIRPLSNSKGLPTNALYGFTAMLLKLIKEERPDHIACVFDVARKTFRNEKYPAYKANRAEPPPDLVPQFPYFRKIARALNIPVLELANYEADDVIGTVAKKMERRKLKTVIVTGDKDLMQLVNEKVVIYDSMKEKRIGIPEVKERFGVLPEQVADVLALAGDSSDNIPGVPGVGEKTAMKLTQEFGSIENLLKNLSKVDGKLKEKLEAHTKEARLFKELATILTDVPIDYDFKDFAVSEPDTKALQELFGELEFHRFLNELAPQQTLSKKGYHLVLRQGEWETLVDNLKNSSGFAFDLETTAVDPMKAHLVGLSFSFKTGEAYYVPVGHTKASLQLSKTTVFDDLKPVFEDPKIPKYGQNMKYDLTVLKRYGLTVKGVLSDSMIASYLIRPEGNHNLELLAQEYLSHKVTTYKEVVGSGKEEKNFSEVDLASACDYSCEDADVTYRLIQILMPKLKEKNLEQLFRTVEMPLMEVLLVMEMNGIKVDPKALGIISEEYAKKLKALEKQIYKIAGEEFNINSPKQLQTILFEKLKLPPVRKTKTGYSTDAEVLEELARSHELPQHLVVYRFLSKLKSTYIDALPEMIHPETGRIHTSFNQTVAATGRLSSSDPNLQNIPARTEEGKRIREAFVAEKGESLLSADYSQIELRLLAHMSQDKKLLAAFKKDEDIHRLTAAQIFQKALEKVTDEERGAAKTVNFAVIYGQSAYGLSQQLGIKPAEAALYIENYYREYQGVADYKEKVLKEAHKTKMVSTLLGRHRHFPDIESANQNIRQNAERMAFNTIFQGTAADIIKVAMIRIHERLQKEKLVAKLLLQVHDELVFEVPEQEIKKLSTLVKEEMEEATQLSVPLKVDIGVGKNWAEAH